MRIWLDITRPHRTVSECLNNIIGTKKFAVYSDRGHDCYWSGSKDELNEQMADLTVNNISIEEDGVVRLWVEEL